MTSRVLPTLFLLHAFIFALLSAFVYLIWREDEEAEEYRWWFFALVVTSFGLLLFSIHEFADPVLIACGNALTLWGLGLAWGGVRVFADRPQRRGFAFVGGAIAIGLFVFTEPSVRLIGRALLVALYSFLLAHELSSYNKERMLALRATSILARFHGCFNLLLAAVVPFVAIGRAGAFNDIPLVEYLALEGLSYSIVLAFSLLVLSRERMVKRQKIAATTDPLTGLSNRRCFDQSATRVISSAKERGTAALLIFDLDCLKTINDRYGHSMGDRALKTFGEVAGKGLRAGDLLARIGGDEFAALLTRVDRATAVAVAERIRAAYATAASTYGDGLASVSVGIALEGRETASLDELKEAADSALYAAKAAGRNQVYLSREGVTGALSGNSEETGPLYQPV